MNFLTKLAIKAYAYNVHIPESNESKNYQAPLNARVDGSESEIYKLINFANEYLRFFILWAAFFAVIYAWLKIIFSTWDQTTSIKDIAINAWVWFLLAILSFAVISIVVNLI